MFDEILKSIRAHLYERAVSPLMGSFIVSWAVWNYKFLLLVLSGIPITEKFDLIENLLFPGWYQILMQGAIYPLITALIYLYLYPYPAIKVYEFSRNRQKEITDIKKKIEEETLLTVKESRAIRGEIFELEESLQKEIERKDNEIQRLKDELNSVNTAPQSKALTAEDILSAPDEKENSLTDILFDDQIEILKEIGSYDDEVSERDIVASSREGNVKAKYNLGELEKNGYIKKDYSQNLGDYSYILTHKGRSFLVEFNHV